jgi:hypothetical protein
MERTGIFRDNPVRITGIVSDVLLRTVGGLIGSQRKARDIIVS